MPVGSCRSSPASASGWSAATPLTPTNIQVQQQSRIGSPRDRQVPPRDVDGATLFAARNGREIREFLFVDTEQAYQAADLALLARHLVQDPVDQDFDQARRLFLIAMTDGSLASIAIYRIADIAAWSLQETAGSVLSVAMAGGETMLLVERANGMFIEQLDDQLMVDAGLRLSQSPPTLIWAGLDHLEGQNVALIADDLVVERSGGRRRPGDRSTRPASELVVGLPFTHVIEPLPAAFGARARRSARLPPTGRCASRSACSRRRVCASIPATGCARSPCTPSAAARRTATRARSAATSRCGRSAGAAAPSSRHGVSSRTRLCPARFFLQPRK